jgi:hypothetical protein
MRIQFNHILLIFLSNIIFSVLTHTIISENTICDATLCNPSGSYCENNQCFCQDCYISINLPNDHRKCNYKQSSSFKAGIIEFIFPIGFGHFYLGNILNGFIKMLAAYFLICFVYVIVIYYFINSRKIENMVEMNLIGNSHRNEYDYFYSNNLIDKASEDALKIKKLVGFSQALFAIIHLGDLYLIFTKGYKDENNIYLC